LSICSFELNGHFATFRKSDTNSVYLTYNNPPYAAILGILGAIAGLSGYCPKRKKEAAILPQFYTSLTGVWLSLHPIFPNRQAFLKQMVTYNNYHGYGSDAGCYQITEQILISPKWKIYLYDEDNQHEQLINNLRNRQTVFTPYLGKNEFRAEIGEFDDTLKIEEEIKLTDEFIKSNKELKLDSLVLLEPIEKHPIVKGLSEGIGLAEYFESPAANETKSSDSEYVFFENYPYALGADLHYKLCLSTFTNWGVDTSTIRKGTRIFQLSDGKTIQMFNGGLE